MQLFGNLLVHPDGTIFTVQASSDTYPWYAYSVVGIDSASGAQKFSVPLPSRLVPWFGTSIHLRATESLLGMDIFTCPTGIQFETRRLNLVSKPSISICCG
jgi:hypothetical protein